MIRTHEEEPGLAAYLVDSLGRPIRSESGANGRYVDGDSIEKSFASSISAYIEQLGQLDMPPLVRARDPFKSHAWVSAAAIATAFVSSQAPYVVFRETDRVQEERRLKMKAAGRAWTGGRAGKGRRARERYLQRSFHSRFLWVDKAAERDDDHPLMDVLTDPNPMQTGSQLMQLTILWLTIRGEFFWLPTTFEGKAVPIGRDPEMLWPIPPDNVTEVYAGGRQHGTLVGWKIAPPKYLPTELQNSTHFVVSVDELIQFKFPDPSNPLRGLSRLTAAAQSIESDLYARAHNSALLKNQGKPSGFVEFDAVLEPKEEEEFQKKWRKAHEEVSKRGRLGILWGGAKYKQAGLSPLDLDFMNLLRWNREELLALVGVHKSILGVTEDINYATMRAATSNLWQMTVVPNMRIVESTLDSWLFYTSPDSVFGMYDVSSVDALRAGLQEKIDQADKLCQQNLHMPPRTAFAVVGLDAPEYFADDTALVQPLATPLEAAVAAANEPAPPAPESLLPAPDPEDEEDPALEEDEARSLGSRRATAARTSKQTAAQRRRRWRQFVRLQLALEKDMGRRYRKWVGTERKATLDRFDTQAGNRGAMVELIRSVRVTKEINLTAILPNLAESGRSLKEKTRPNRAASLEATYQFSLDDIGIPTFAIDDVALLRHFDLRERIFSETTPATLRDGLYASLQTGIQNGETIQQLRSRVAEIYDVAAGSPKTLMVARTETSSFMNGIRNEMFGLQGVSKEQWTTAGDGELVRPTHRVYGASGVKPRGFNYLSLVGLEGQGALRYPGDSEAPAGETINCRCVAFPAD